jgi:hypothetical protein
MNLQLAKINKIDLDLAEITLTDHSMIIGSVAAFERAGRALDAMDSYSQWWWGDYLLYAEQNNLKTVLDDARRSLHRSTIYQWKEVARYYPPALRHPRLHFNHHYSAFYILGPGSDPAKAEKWLARAEENEWTVGDLREAIRMDSRRDEHDPGPMRGIIRITDFVKISRWTAKVHADELPPAQLEEIRASTGPLFDFLCEVHRKSFSIK